MTEQSEQTAPTTPPAIFRLPYTGEAVPESLSLVKVEITGSMQGREGEAFSANLLWDKIVLGEIRNDGHGGGTFFYQYTREAGDMWDTAVAEMKRILVEVDHDEFGDTFADETLADRLYDNMALFKELNRKRSVLVRVNGDNDDIRMHSLPAKEHLDVWEAKFAEHQEAAKAKGGGETRERWIKGQGWEAL